MTTIAQTQLDLFGGTEDVEREQEKIAKANEERSRRRGYLVFATNPDVPPDDPAYRDVYATEAKTPNQAVAKVRGLAGRRRLRAYLATGIYKAELAEARWVR